MMWINIDRSANIPLTKQICEQLRTKILTRELQTEERLPPTRKLAQELNVSRNVVIYAYEQLISEGYLESREGSGTYVTEGTYLEQYKDYYSYEFERDYSIKKETQEQDMIDFQSGVPDLSHFPRKIWAKLLREVCLDSPATFFDYSPPEGTVELRQTLSKFLLKTKGIRCHPDQIIVLSGSAQGLATLAQLLAPPYREFIIEDPVYSGIHQILQALELSCAPVPVDEKGMRVDDIPFHKPASGVFVTPSHQFPIGSVLPIQRRVKLIEYARQTQTYILENDYDSEFRYVGDPISSLHLLDPEYVVHVGTFSESLYPSVRLGYMILPDALLEKCRTLKASLGLATSALKQLALSRFIEEGYLERHITRMKKLYREKRAIIIACLKSAFSDNIVISGDSTGLYVVAEFHNINFSEDLMQNIHQQNVRIYRVEDHAMIKGKHLNKVIIGYGNLTEDEITRGIERLKHALDKSI